MKSIAFISTMSGYPWGGSEELWSQAALRLRESGLDVAVCVKDWAKPVPQVAALEKAGCTVRKRRPASCWARLARRLTRRGLDLDVEWVKDQKPQLVVISQGGFSEARGWARACQVMGVNYAMVAQAVLEHGWPGDEAAEALASAYLNAVRSYFVSTGNQELVEAMLGRRLPNARVIRNPFKVRWDAHPAWPSAELGYRIACVGRLEPKAKGQDLIFGVLAARRWQDRSLRVSFYGDGPNEKTLRLLAEMHGLRNVGFAGSTPDVEAIWKENHALLLPSRYEGLPLALVEAMLCGRPVITTKVAGNAELLEDNVTGFIAKAPTVELLEEAMERAWERRNDWEAMGILAAKRVRELVPPDPVAEFVKELQSLLP